MLQKLVKNVASTSNTAPSRETVSVIGVDVRIVGNIVAQGEVQVDGQVDGDITCSTLIIGEGGRVTGAITADRVRVHGELTGRMNATTVCIARTGKVVGDITHESLEIEAGAHVEGHCVHKATMPKIEPKQIEAKPAEANKPVKLATA